MTAPKAGSLASLALLLGLAAACTNFIEIPIETPIQAKLDVSPFQRVLVAGFIAGGSEEVDANLETVRLLRSQLRTKSGLKVIDADVLPLIEIVAEENKAADGGGTTAGTSSRTSPSNGNGSHTNGGPSLPTKIKDEKDLETYAPIFANANFWKKIGEEYQNPLIVTGTILFSPESKSGMVQRDQEVFDSLGRRRVIPIRTYLERKGFVLQPKFVFIDGRTGTVIYSESQREERLYPAQQNTPALSSYFEMMDTIVPVFLNTLSTQKVKGSRVLLK